MKPAIFIGVVLIVLSIFSFAYQGITYSNEDAHNHYQIQVPDGYNAMKSSIQHDQVIKAGARLAQILKNIFPDQ